MIVDDSIMSPGQVCILQYIRNYSNYNINKFQERLSYEIWYMIMLIIFLIHLAIPI
jgi:beta-lactamase regulating signal transducer with metallopeptidase domain